MSIMRKFITILILIFSAQFSAQADDIKEFELEGISIGDSLLDYFSKQEILASKADWYNDDTYSTAMLTLDNFEIFKDIDISYLTSDKNFTIVGLAAIHSEANEDNCRSIQNEIVNDLSKIFDVKVIRETLIHPVDKSGESKVEVADFDLDDGSRVGVQCFFFSKNVDFQSGLKLSIVNEAYIVWNSTIAYK